VQCFPQTKIKMMKIQKKSLQHVSDTLKSFNTYPIYKVLIDAMTEAGIDNAVRSKIAHKYQAAISEQSKKVSDAKDWLDTLISDVE
jgi:sulfur relay (sulfurtransferase) DsrC/TusE family protein